MISVTIYIPKGCILIILLKEITKQNWVDVVLLSSSEDQKNMIVEKKYCFQLLFPNTGECEREP